MKRNFTYLLALLICCCFTFCKKKGLPAPTTSGENTFGCKINGEDWKPRKASDDPFGFNGQPLTARYSQISQGVFIKAFRHLPDKSYNEQISLVFKNPVQNDTAKIEYTQSSTMKGFESCSFYSLDTTQNRYVIINRFDIDEQIISGTFEFQVIGTENCDDTIYITDGRFDTYFSIE